MSSILKWMHCTLWAHASNTKLEYDWIRSLPHFRPYVVFCPVASLASQTLWIKNSRFSRDVADMPPAVEREQSGDTLEPTEAGTSQGKTWFCSPFSLTCTFSLHPNVVQVYCCRIDGAHTLVGQRRPCNLFTGGTTLRELFRSSSYKWSLALHKRNVFTLHLFYTNGGNISLTLSHLLSVLLIATAKISVRTVLHAAGLKTNIEVPHFKPLNIMSCIQSRQLEIQLLLIWAAIRLPQLLRLILSSAYRLL